MEIRSNPTIGPIGDRWYTFLKPNNGRGLFDSIPRSQIHNYFVVYSMVNGYRRYAGFYSSVNFYKFYCRMVNREVHEVILGEVRQKPRFDIDLTMENCPPQYRKTLLDFGNRIRESIIIGAIQVFKDHGIDIDVEKDITICTSHSPEVLNKDNDKLTNESKYSCHIIFHNYFHNNHREAKEFFDLTINHSSTIDPLMERAVSDGILDRGIYTSLCSLRMIGSGKNGKRIKSISMNMLFKGKVYSINPFDMSNEQETLQAFRRTCITDVSGCDLIPIIVPLKNDKYASVDLPEETVNEILLCLARSLKCLDEKGNPDIEAMPFKLGKVEDSKVILTRKSPSECRLCRRVHPNIDQYIQVTEGGNLYLYCFRALAQIRDKNRHSYYIGSVDLPNKEPSPEPEGNKGSEPGSSGSSRSSNIRVQSVRLPPRKKTPSPPKAVPKASPAASPKIGSSVGDGKPPWKGCDFSILTNMSRQYVSSDGKIYKPM